MPPLKAQRPFGLMATKGVGRDLAEYHPYRRDVTRHCHSPDGPERPDRGAFPRTNPRARWPTPPWLFAGPFGLPRAGAASRPAPPRTFLWPLRAAPTDYCR